MNQERNTPKRHSGVNSYPVAAGAVIYAGALVALEGGYAVPGKAAAGLVAVGRANATADNAGGAAGARRIDAERGTFLYDNSATDPVTLAEAGKECFIENAQTVAKTDGAGARSRAGIVAEVTDSGVWVEI